MLGYGCWYGDICLHPYRLAHADGHKRVCEGGLPETPCRHSGSVAGAVCNDIPQAPAHCSISLGSNEELLCLLSRMQRQ